jgi:hypothetical protein
MVYRIYMEINLYIFFLLLLYLVCDIVLKTHVIPDLLVRATCGKSTSSYMLYMDIKRYNFTLNPYPPCSTSSP